MAIGWEDDSKVKDARVAIGEITGDVESGARLLT